MSLARKISDKISEQGYLDGELISEVKHEYIDGFVYAMAGASENHDRISQNISYQFGDALRKQKLPCDVFSSDMKIRISSHSTQYFYPDTSIVCGKHEHDTEYYKHSPVILIEVLSDSTRKADKTTKKLSYFNIPTLQEYVTIEQRFCEIVVFRRKNDWKSDFYFLGDSITFESIGVALSVEDIYYRVDNGEMVAYWQNKEQKEQPHSAPFESTED